MWNFTQIRKWALEHPRNENNIKLTQAEEREWGNKMIGNTIKTTSQWTTKLGEYLVYEILNKQGLNPRRPNTLNHYSPDWETDDYMYEVKSRNWTTTGTAGEKVYGTPLKYAEVPELYKKPLKIVCVAFQEYELTHGHTPILGPNIRPEQQKYIDFYNSNKIFYVPCSELINQLD